MEKTNETSCSRAFNMRTHQGVLFGIVVFGSEIDNRAIAHRQSIDRLPILAL